VNNTPSHLADHQLTPHQRLERLEYWARIIGEKVGIPFPPLPDETATPATRFDRLEKWLPPVAEKISLKLDW
jgi:hypothetical protein